MHPEPPTVKSFSPPTTEARIGLTGNPEQRERPDIGSHTATSEVTHLQLIHWSKVLLALLERLVREVQALEEPEQAPEVVREEAETEQR